MQVIPLQALPAQISTIVLGGQQCEISVYTKTGYAYSDVPEFTVTNESIYLDLTSNGVTITTTALCLNGNRLLRNREYLGFVGELMFVDLQGDDPPQPDGLGTRWVLLYLSADDLSA